MGKKKTRVIMPWEEKEIYNLYKEGIKKALILRLHEITAWRFERIVRDATHKENMQKQERQKEKLLEARKKLFKLND